MLQKDDSSHVLKKTRFHCKDESVRHLMTLEGRRMHKNPEFEPVEKDEDKEESKLDFYQL